MIDEFRIRNMMEGLVKNDGLVSSFSMNSATVKAQFMNREEAPIQEFLLGNGLRWSKGRIGNLESTAVERNIMSSIRTEDVFWPSEITR